MTTATGIEQRQKDGIDDDEDTTAERFLSHLLRFLLVPSLMDLLPPMMQKLMWETLGLL